MLSCAPRIGAAFAASIMLLGAAASESPPPAGTASLAGIIAAEEHARERPLNEALRPSFVDLIRRYVVLANGSPDEGERGEALLRAAALYTDLFRTGRENADLREGLRLYDRVVESLPDHPLAPAACLRSATLRLEGSAALSGSTGGAGTSSSSYADGYRGLLRCAERYSETDEGNEATRLSGMLRVLRPAGVVGPTISVPVGPSGIPGEVFDSARLIVPAAEGIGTLRAVTHVSSASYTRVVAHLDRPVHFTAGEAPPGGGRPARLYIDLYNTAAGAGVPEAIPVGDGLLRAARAARYSRTTTRVVLDLDRVGRFRVFPLREPFRVIIDLFPKTPEAEVPPPHRTVADLEAALAASGRSLSELAGLAVRRIVLDPGHGGADRGAVSPSGLAEKDVNLDVATKLATLLRSRLGTNVMLTRSSDVAVPLEERTALANASRADLFVSVHANAAENREARGIEVYHLDIATDDRALHLAARENATSVRSLTDLSTVLGELVTRSHARDSGALADAVQRGLVGRVRSVHGDVIDRGTRTALLYVLLGAQMPAILVETSFLSNPVEGARLGTDAYRKVVAEGVADGLAEFVRSRAR